MMPQRLLLAIFAGFAFLANSEGTSFFTSQDDFNERDLRKLPESLGENFYYFSYGCDMLYDHLLTEVSSALEIGPALLRYHRLDFNMQSQRWRGALPTIVIDSSSDVYGTLWKISLINMERLNSLESNDKPLYVPYRAPIEITETEKIVIARTYQLQLNPLDSIYSFNETRIPSERLPSKSYLKCMVKGAEHNGLPDVYVNFLRKLKHNGQLATEFELLYDLYDVYLRKM